jgi:uncharacterized damage-inducible protein DinB
VRFLIPTATISLNRQTEKIMFRTIKDFEQTWAYESDATLKMFRALTNASLAQQVADKRRTLGNIAWHLVLTLGEMTHRAGLPVKAPDERDDAPEVVDELVAAYQKESQSVADVVCSTWTDASLEEQIPIYGETWTKGKVLSVLVSHQTHHRGQMTVLMRQAGLQVPGVYGPSHEEWASMGMTPQK